MRKSLFLFAGLMLSISCLDRIDFGTDDSNNQTIVIDGVITDQPGPYTVRIFRVSDIEDNLLNAVPISARHVTIHDSDGNSELLTEVATGIFQTAQNGMQGEVGKSYSVHIEARDGTRYESIPDKMYPNTSIDTLYKVWDPISATEFGFRIYMNTKNVPGEDSYLRWRYSGTYIGKSLPKEHRLNGNPNGPPDPLPCSGFVFEGGILQNPTGQECTCCTCWVTDHEAKPHINDEKVQTDGTFKQIKVGYVPVNGYTFQDGKYMSKVEQMSLSREAYDYWRTIRDQKDGISSLFQPAMGRLQTNMRSTNSTKEARGFFYASSVRTKVLFITWEDLPINITPASIGGDFFWFACDEVYLNASRTPPPEWE